MEKPSDFDRAAMKRALALAKKGWGRTYPNPMVGAVIVKNGRIIGEGWHRGPGLPHAEVEALTNCRADPGGATLYVTLEPCNHYGRTPPCTEAVLKAGIAEVKYAVPDPNPRVAGGGAERLREAGVHVEEGIGRSEALELNRGYFHHCLTGRPWVILKAAMSLDGKIAGRDGESKWITSLESRRFVHRLRAQAGAVLVGGGTARKDDPLLTNRLAPPFVRQPFKVVLDGGLSLSEESNLVRQDPQRLIVFCTDRAPSAKERALEAKGVRVFRRSAGGKVDLRAALSTLGALGVQSVLVEGGREVFTSFMEQDLVDEFYLFYAPFFVGGTDAVGVLGGPGSSVTEARRLDIRSVRRIGGDLLVHAFKPGVVPDVYRNCS